MKALSPKFRLGKNARFVYKNLHIVTFCLNKTPEFPGFW
ncbi:hypothetical protein PL9631_520026 [Planktothrix paucivesiculata PCC 9631]|uniref:Uncharacterized protein n=1 Tax=Planktothrix paucivesiculata PCC 9631 TaxID=671071 RepID=A0A7Z9DZY8_9CYAN|nr:hypothetical protein PL9631_520026 [Planktothrix paucivesiculata PCC 9631]